MDVNNPVGLPVAVIINLLILDKTIVLTSSTLIRKIEKKIR